MEQTKKYFIGLDIGSDSVGWAATNEDYSLVKFRGNAQWGIRLLEESNTAEERRMYRTARRRLERRKFRQQCLEMLFNEEISKVDVSFFQRLKESSLVLEDKTETVKYSIFNDSDFTDKDYHKKYPTIYHLRKELIESDKNTDIRLLYLAVHHIVKNRGHFLFDAENFGASGSPDFNIVWEELNAFLYDNLIIDDEPFTFDCSDTLKLQKLLKSKDLTKTAKKDEMMTLFGLDKKSDRRVKAIVTLLAGASAKSCDLFDDDELKDSDAKNISFSSGYDANESVYESTFGDRFELVEMLKAVYDWGVLAEILDGERYLSIAKVKTYEQHKNDLKTLKAFVKEFIPEKYKKIFDENDSKVKNYLAYSGYSKKSSVEKKASYEDFCDFLKKVLPSTCPSDKYLPMYNAIAAGTFLPKCVNNGNGVIPMQLNKAELGAILTNAKKNFPFLDEKDENGISVADKIVSVFSFRIPYYVGPLNNKDPKSKAWLERKDGTIYPWNFNEKVDLEKSAENFIVNLTSKCTYLPQADVIPRQSLLYSAFTVLNELNNLKLDGEKISVSLKQDIYRDLFMKRAKVTRKGLANYLKSKGCGEPEITGFDGDFKSNLKPFGDLKNIPLSDAEKESVIKDITIFGDDKKMLKKRLKNKFGNVLSDDDIKVILKLKYTGWSKLSKEFLTGIKACVCNKENGELIGENVNIIHALWETNDNLMQLLSGEYDFVKELEKAKGSSAFTTLKDEVEALYVSPKVKRSIYQSMKIVDELVGINGCAPEKIFVEMARGPQEKKPTVSRRNKLVELYNVCKKDEPEIYKELMSKKDETEFRRDALYLYFTQLGRCMYTGQPIDINKLYDRTIYDIDHIYPRSKIKDDSLDNRVLVLKTANSAKTNTYPINRDIQNSRKSFWAMLRSKELISEKKYERLTRTTPLTDEELSSFISRQIVETRQSTKAVAELLKKRYPNTEIVYVKAGLVSDFRQEYGMIKCREINDLHHAKDAYLNIVVGNVYNVCFTHSRAIYVKDLQRGTVSLNGLFTHNVAGAWDCENNRSIELVRKTMKKNNIRFTRYSSEQHGGLFDQNPLKKGSGTLISLKTNGNSPLADVEKYGGYNRPKSKYFVVAEYLDAKGKTVRSFEAIDAYAEKEYLKNPDEFIAKQVGAQSVKIIVPKVKYNTLISLDGFRMHISSKSGGGSQLVCKPAMQLVLSEKSEYSVKKISSYLNKCTEMKKEKNITAFDEITAENNLAVFDELVAKMSDTIFRVKFENTCKKVSGKREVFIALSLYEQCVVVNELLNILHCNVRTGDLGLIKEASKSGSTTISNKIPERSKVNSFKIIHQSVTGLFESEVDLLV